MRKSLMHRSRATLTAVILTLSLTGVLTAQDATTPFQSDSSALDDSERLLTIDHFVRVRSTVPAIAGQTAQLYVRERVKAGNVLQGPSPAERVVLFVHGAGTPGEV